MAKRGAIQMAAFSERSIKTKGPKPSGPAPGLAEIHRRLVLEHEETLTDLRRALIRLGDFEHVVSLVRAFVASARGRNEEGSNTLTRAEWAKKFSVALIEIKLKRKRAKR